MGRKLWIAFVVVIIVITVVAWRVVNSNMTGMDQAKISTQNNTTYSLNLMNMAASSSAYPVMKSTELMFDIRNQDNNVVKNFDIVHEKKLHLIVIRKDRTNFQHVHPSFDESTGLFAITDIQFPADGDYRLFADFTPTDAKKDDMGVKEAVTPYQDIKVGDENKYAPIEIGDDKLTSSVNSFDTAIFFAPSDDSPGGKPNTDYYSGQDTSVAIEINTGGKPYTNLQTYLGALGHMVVIGPDLEFIHAHPQTTDINNQSGLAIFSVKFPDAGKYKLYLQTQANNQVNTTDYTLTVKSNPGSASGSTQNTQSMQGMDHSGN